MWRDHHFSQRNRATKEGEGYWGGFGCVIVCGKMEGGR